jgi:hypothetical protein
MQSSLIWRLGLNSAGNNTIGPVLELGMGMGLGLGLGMGQSDGSGGVAPGLRKSRAGSKLTPSGRPRGAASQVRVKGVQRMVL